MAVLKMSKSFPFLKKHKQVKKEEVEVEKKVEREVEGGDVVESGEDFMKWLLRGEEKRVETNPKPAEQDETCYRCDIFPTSGKDFSEAEKECKQLIVEAGGSVVTEKAYPGGFMYTLPKDFSGTPPLESSVETLLGGHIRITEVAPGATIEPAEPETQQPSFQETQLTDPTLETEPVSPLTAPGATAAITTLDPVNPLPRRRQPSAISTTPDASTEWPRPNDDSRKKRAADWVKQKAAQQKVQIEEEMRAGVDKEVMSESEYEGGVGTGHIYMDGYNDLAIWMGAGGPS